MKLGSYLAQGFDCAAHSRAKYNPSGWRRALNRKLLTKRTLSKWDQTAAADGCVKLISIDTDEVRPQRERTSFALLAIFVERLRHFQMMLQSGQGLPGPIFQFGILAALRVSLKE